jgi:SSS family solute:Na+ symporter
MTVWLGLIGGLYLVLLIYATLVARRKTSSANDYIMAGSNVGVILGFLTFGATLFSTFTLMGMPDFFRTHGVGAWIFLGVSDAAVAFVVLWYASHLRRRVANSGFKGIAGFLRDCYQTKWAGVLYFVGVFVFLTPYVAIQIRGISIFLDAVFPNVFPEWGWATSIVVVMLVYSEIGGLKAIIYSDALQGVLLLIVTWIIAYTCLRHFGGLSGLFDSVRDVQPGLLSTPGPRGLFSTQFLIASFLVVILLPITQPQLATRLLILKDVRTSHLMALALGVFAMAVILPTIVIGMYGAIEYEGLPASEFLSRVLFFDQPAVIGATVAVGLIAAAMSSADSQIFALGTELRSLLSGKEQLVMVQTKIAIVGFALTALVFAILSSDQLVLLARVSFAGTALMGPLILAAVLTRSVPGNEIIIISALGLTLFVLALLGVIPDNPGGVRIDLLLLTGTFGLTAVSVLIRKFRARTFVQKPLP